MRPPLHAPAAILLVLAVALAACAGGSPSEAPTSVPATASSSGPQALPSPRADPGFIKQPDGTFAFQPLSARVVAGIVYAYTAFTHCGLTGTTFDFDGSFWDIAGEGGQVNPPPGFGNPEDGGTIVLVAPNEAIFTSSSGIVVPLVRADGPRSGFPCD